MTSDIRPYHPERHRPGTICYEPERHSGDTMNPTTTYFGSLSAQCFLYRHDECDYQPGQIADRECGCGCHHSGMQFDLKDITLGDGLLDAMFEVWWQNTGRFDMPSDPNDHRPVEAALHKGALHRGFVAGARGIFDAIRGADGGLRR